MSDDLVSKRRAKRCTTHSHACDCREYAHAQEIERLRAEVADLRRINQFDGAELRALCAARDEARRERDALRDRIEGAAVVKVRGAAIYVSHSLIGKRVALVPVDE